MSGDITMAQVIEALKQVLTDDGIAHYLDTPVDAFDGHRPIELCATPEGRYAVWHRYALIDGAFS